MSQLFHFQHLKFLLKFEYCKNQNRSLDETESIFHNFWRALFWWNVKYYVTQAFNMNKDRKKSYHFNPIFNIWLVVASSFRAFVAYIFLEIEMKL